MVTSAYRAWVRAGSRWFPARPIMELRDWAGNSGVPVLGTIGNHDHLTSDRPLDHTPFASTQWPVHLDKPYVCAIDLANVRRDGRTLGEAIEAQARGGQLPWLKYMNHGGVHLDSRDLDGDGRRWEEYDSADEHVHLSIRTDWAERSIGSFDPWGDGEMGAEQVWGDDAIRVTEATAKRLPNAKAGDKRSGGLLLQEVVIDVQDVKIMCGELRQSVAQLVEAVQVIATVVAKLTGPPGDKPAPVKATPATVAKKATGGK